MFSTGKLLELGLTANIVVEQTSHHIASVYCLSCIFSTTPPYSDVFPAEASCVMAAAAQQAGFRGYRPLFV